MADVDIEGQEELNFSIPALEEFWIKCISETPVFRPVTQTQIDDIETRLKARFGFREDFPNSTFAKRKLVNPGGLIPLCKALEAHIKGEDSLDLSMVSEPMPWVLPSFLHIKKLDLSNCDGRLVIEANIDDSDNVIRHLVGFDRSNITQLVVHDSYIKNLDDIKWYPSLEELTLHNGHISELPDALFELTELRHLDLRGCKRLDISPEKLNKLAQLEKLQSLGLPDHIETDSLPEALSNIRVRDSLPIESIAPPNPADIAIPGAPKNLDSLDILQQLEDYKDADGQIPGEDRLWVNVEMMKIIKNNRQKMTEGDLNGVIKKFNASSRNLSAMPPCLDELLGVEEVDFSFNSLSNFDPSLLRSASVVSIKISYNFFRTINEFIGLLKLRVLEAQKNHISNFWCTDRYFVHLNLDKNRLTDKSFDGINLTISKDPFAGAGQLDPNDAPSNLFLGSNRLENWPPKFLRDDFDPNSPRVIDVQNNFISNITINPPPRSDLVPQPNETLVPQPNETLDFSFNPIRSIPIEIFYLQTNYLDLSYCKLESLPEFQAADSEQCKTLFLSLEANPLSEISVEIKQLRLKSLDLSRTLITNLDTLRPLELELYLFDMQRIDRDTVRRFAIDCNQLLEENEGGSVEVYYSGQRFMFTESTTLMQAVDQWFNMHPLDEMHDIAKAWDRYNNAEGAADGKQLLDKLSESIVFENEEFRQLVQDDLSYMISPETQKFNWQGKKIEDAQQPEELDSLVERSLKLADHFAVSCTDRAMVGYMEWRKMRIRHQAIAENWPLEQMAQLDNGFHIVLTSASLCGDWADHQSKLYQNQLERGQFRNTVAPDQTEIILVGTIDICKKHGNPTGTPLGVHFEVLGRDYLPEGHDYLTTCTKVLACLRAENPDGATELLIPYLEEKAKVKEAAQLPLVETRIASLSDWDAFMELLGERIPEIKEAHDNTKEELLAISKWKSDENERNKDKYLSQFQTRSQWRARVTELENREPERRLMRSFFPGFSNWNAVVSEMNDIPQALLPTIQSFAVAQDGNNEPIPISPIPISPIPISPIPISHSEEHFKQLFNNWISSTPEHGLSAEDVQTVEKLFVETLFPSITRTLSLKKGKRTAAELSSDEESRPLAKRPKQTSIEERDEVKSRKNGKYKEIEIVEGMAEEWFYLEDSNANAYPFLTTDYQMEGQNTAQKVNVFEVESKLIEDSKLLVLILKTDDCKNSRLPKNIKGKMDEYIKDNSDGHKRSSLNLSSLRPVRQTSRPRSGSRRSSGR